MILSPIPVELLFRLGNDRPSLWTVRTIAPAPSPRLMPTDLALACLMALVTASCAILYNCPAMLESSAGMGPFFLNWQEILNNSAACWAKPSRAATKDYAT